MEKWEDRKSDTGHQLSQGQRNRPFAEWRYWAAAHERFGYPAIETSPALRDDSSPVQAIPVIMAAPGLGQSGGVEVELWNYWNFALMNR